MRYRLVEDNDGYWYVIPAEMQNQFKIWVRDIELGNDSEWDFDADVIGGSPSNFTFENPKF